ncbi:MAG TPA: class E sortase [Nocardioidaceae bacterium]
MSQETGTVATADDPARPEGPPPRRRRGLSFWLGLVLVLAGAGMLGYVAWQMYGTNIVSKQTQQRLVEDLERQWTEPGTTLEERPGEGSAGEVTAGEVPLGDASALIRIPAFGDDYVVPVVEGISDADLASGYGHFPDSADPGEKGNYALAAHRVTHGEPLRDMPQLRPGDEVVVETRDAVHTYELLTDPNDLIVTFEDVWVVDPLPTNPTGGPQPSQEPGQRLITLTTCSELFHTDNRMIAFGELVDTERK